MIFGKVTKKKKVVLARIRFTGWPSPRKNVASYCSGTIILIKREQKNHYGGSGLHRYVSDDLAVQILRDAVKVKWGTEDQSLAEDFLSHYCALHSISPEDIGEPRGALKI